jgi:hypothetical protein
LKKTNKHSASSRAKAHAAHLDGLLDEALRETFPASDPVAITVDKLPMSTAPSDGLCSADARPMDVPSQEAAVSQAPPVVGFFDLNLWALRQISFYFEWWSHLLGGDRK